MLFLVASRVDMKERYGPGFPAGICIRCVWLFLTILALKNKRGKSNLRSSIFATSWFSNDGKSTKQVPVYDLTEKRILFQVNHDYFNNNIWNAISAVYYVILFYEM